MSSITVACIVFGCVFGSSVLAMIIRRFLPDHHLNAESRDVLKLGMGFIATLAALVLGLLIATAKGTYDAQGAVIRELAANQLLLDRLLSRFDPETPETTKEARELLKKASSANIARIWPQADGEAPDLTPGGESKATGDALFDMVARFPTKTDVQRELRSRAQNLMTDMAQARLRLLAQSDSSLPVPFLVVLVFWLAILFVGYGLLSPCNATVVAVLIICTMSISGAVFLMLELSTPFRGILSVSSEPLRHALSLMGQ